MIASLILTGCIVSGASSYSVSTATDPPPVIPQVIENTSVDLSARSGLILVIGVGTENAILVSVSNGTCIAYNPLKGDKGDTGPQGLPGPQGIQGIQGPIGEGLVKGSILLLEPTNPPSSPVGYTFIGSVTWMLDSKKKLTLNLYKKN